ncbi:MAG TPA: hypothetical protein EYQ26_02880 [Rhodospirillales bacterium]|jgi:hypothetical protein|nr:hypothetical protein [Rhodospirillales bacterium]
MNNLKKVKKKKGSPPLKKYFLFIFLLFIAGSGIVALYFWVSTPTFDDEAYSELLSIVGISDVLVDGDEYGTNFMVTIKPGAKTDFDSICHLIWTEYRIAYGFDFKIGKNGNYNEYACPDKFHPDLN